MPHKNHICIVYCITIVIRSSVFIQFVYTKRTLTPPEHADVVLSVKERFALFKLKGLIGL